MINAHKKTRVSIFPLIRSTLWIALIQLVLISHVIAQSSATDTRTPAGLTPGSPAGSYALSGFDNINLYTGGLNFRLPLLQVGGRGGASYTMMLPIEQKWRVNHDFADQGQHWPNHNWWTGLRPGYGPGVLQGRQTHEGCGDGGPWPGGEAQTGSMTTLTFTAPDGTEYELRDELTGGNRLTSTCCCYYQQHANGASRGTVFKTFDGTAATFISDANIYDWSGNIESGPHILEPTGYFILRDGTRYRIEWGQVMWIRDRNGNKLTFEYNSPYGMTRVTDSLDRQVTVEYDVNDPQYGLCDQISFNGFGGTPRKIWVAKSTLGSVLRTTQPYDITSPQTYAQLFLYLTGSSTTYHNPTGTISSVWLPDGRRYQLLYNTYSELARVVLPTGGAVEYDWGEGGGGTICSQGPEIRRRVFERRVYREGSTLEGKVTYEGIDVVSRDANGTPIARGKHYFHGGATPDPCPSALSHSQWNEGKEYQTEEYTSDGVTLLRRINTTFQQTTPGGHPSVWTAEPSNDPKLVSTLTTIEPNGANRVTKQTAINPQTGAVGFDQFNNQTDVWEYDFGAGAPGAFVRRTHTDFVTAATYVDAAVNPALGAHLRSLPSQRWVSSDAGGANRMSFTTYEYDNYSDDMRHKPLVARPGITGHDLAYNTSFTTRGNLTGVTSYANAAAQAEPVIASSQYDVAGNAVKSIDPREKAATITYSDSFCNGTTCGGTFTPNTFAFPASTTSPVPDPTGQFGSQSPLVTTSVYDFYTGLVTSTTDANGQVTNTQYNDPLGRPTQVSRAVGTSGASQTTFIYDDSNRIITTTSDKDNLNDNILKSQTLYDGLGRTIETLQYEGGTNYIVTKQQYDALGRAFKTSNPFRPWQSESPVWTTSGFDALGRMISVTTPDSAVVSTTYIGNSVTVTDQAGKQRRSLTDSLGRLVRVDEPDATGSLGDVSTPVQPTSYAYDILGNLHTVTQGSQQRFFMYDSLSRLIRARNPEQSINTNLNLTDAISGNSQWCMAYTYDGNGNLLSKTDARNIASTYAYDALNRPKTILYRVNGQPDPNTGDVEYLYDTATHGKGRLASVSSSVSTYSYSAYDAMGRVRSGSQTITNQTGSQTYLIDATYDLAGHVKSMTYPSRETVNYVYDSAGRLNKFTGNLGEVNDRDYATNMTYSSLGGITEEKYGTDIPLYNKRHYNVRGQLFDNRLSTVPWATDEWAWDRGAILNWYDANTSSFENRQNSGPDNNGNVRRSQSYTVLPGGEQAYYTDDYAYDSLNRLESINAYRSGAHQFIQAYIYDRYGNRTINAALPAAGINKKQVTVNAANNRLGVPVGQSGTMTYDNAGNLTTDTYSGWGLTRAYDAENRMTQETQANNFVASYGYDGDGRRVKRTTAVTGQPSSVVETWQVYGPGGELLAEYAANAAAATPQKEYGYRNGQLLVTATVSAGGWGPAPVFASPNPLVVGVTEVKAVHITELRTAIDAVRSHHNLAAYAWQYSVTTNDWISANPIIEMRTALDAALGAPPGGYSAGLGLGLPIKAIHIQELRDRVLAAWNSGAGGVDIRWLVADHLGTPRIIFDQTGSLAGVSRHDYLPFGEELFAGAGGRTPTEGYTNSDAVRQKFTSKERDNETGLDYFLARYYSSTQGRFTSPDEFSGGPDELYDFVEDASENPTFYAELDNPQSLNKYQYTYNNPLRYTDPNGHCVGVLTFLRPLCTKAGTKVIERATPYVAAGVGALAGAVARIGEGNTGDPSCPACGSSERMGQALMKRNEQSRRQSQQQGQGQSNTASPNPNDNDKKPIFGEKGTQTTSTTVGSGKGWRVDVENPNPGQRPGQIHYQSGDTKLLYDPSAKSFVGASKSQNKQLLSDPNVQRAIKKGLKVLGETQ